MTWNRNVNTYPHEVLWRAAKSSLRSATVQHDHIREDHLAILSLLAGFLAFEGFVNMIGSEVAPDAWSKERKFFSTGKHRGIMGKVDYLFTLFPGIKLNKETPPYLTFAQVKEVRDSIAHNKPVKYLEKSDSHFPECLMPWSDFKALDDVSQALDHLKELAELIRTGALSILKEEYALSHIHYRAFGGPILSSHGEEV